MLSELKNILHYLANKNAAPDNSEIETEIDQPGFVLGEHVIVFWLTPTVLNSCIYEFWRILNLMALFYHI